jgi:hypothetical protein
MGNDFLHTWILCRARRAFVPTLGDRAFGSKPVVFGASVSFYRGAFADFLYIFFDPSNVLNSNLAICVSAKKRWDTLYILFSPLAAGRKFFESFLAHKIYFCMEMNRIFAAHHDVFVQIQHCIVDLCKQLRSRRNMSLPIQQSISVPRMEVVYWKVGKIFRCQHTANPLFEATDAQKAVRHASRFPNSVVNHVMLPATFVPASSFARARRGVDTAIFADVAHFAILLYTRGSIVSRVVLISILRVVVSYLSPLRASSTTRRTTSLVVRPSALASSWSQSNWGSLKVTDCLAMWRSVAPLYAVVKE